MGTLPSVPSLRLQQVRLRWLASAMAAAIHGGCGASPAVSGLGELAFETLPAIAPSSPDQVPFGRIADIEIGGDGSVFVLDELNRNVRAFDREAVERWAFGSPGRGPGQFQAPMSLLWGPDGNLWVLDPPNLRLTVVSIGGEFVATHRLVDPPIFFPFAVAFSAGDILEWVGISSPDPASPSAAWVESRVVEGEVRPVTRTDLPFVEWPELFRHESEEMVVILPVPFSGEPLFRFDPSGRLWYSHTASPFVHRWAPGGPFDLTVGRELDAIPITRAEREEVLASPEFEEVRSIGQSAVSEMSQMIPDARPFLSDFFFDDEGALWIVRPTGPAPEGGQHAVDVYEPSGDLVATSVVRLGREPRPRVRSRTLVAVVKDELDVESVVRYRIVR